VGESLRIFLLPFYIKHNADYFPNLHFIENQQFNSFTLPDCAFQMT